MTTLTTGVIAMAGAIGVGWLSLVPADVPERLESLPAGFTTAAVQLAQAQAARAADGSMEFDFTNETVGAEPKSFLSVVGFWTIGAEGDNKFLVVDGRRWKQGQPAANLADKARAIYGERYAEFLDNVQAYAYFPYAVAQGIDDFRGGRDQFPVQARRRAYRSGRRDPVQSKAERRLPPGAGQCARKQPRAVQIREGQALKR